MTAYYLVEHVDDHEVVIRDVGPWDRFQTVTNAAEEVIEELNMEKLLYYCTNCGENLAYEATRYMDHKKRRVFYYDSEENLDEILVEDGKFAGFAPGRRERKQ